MLVLERYARLLENAGEDLSNIVSSFENAGDVYANHTLEHKFNERDYVKISLTENSIAYINPDFNKIPFPQRSLAKNMQLNPRDYELRLTFVYNGSVFDDGISVNFDSLGKIIPLDGEEDKQKTSFKIEHHVPLFERRFRGIDTSVGADFEPVAQALTNLYKDLKSKPKKYSDKIAHEEFEAELKATQDSFSF